MTKKKHTPAYPTELHERGVRLFHENRSEYTSDNPAYRAIAPKPGCSPDSLRGRCQQAERDLLLQISLASLTQSVENWRAPRVRLALALVSHCRNLAGQGGSGEVMRRLDQ